MIGPNYGWFAAEAMAASFVAHRLPTGALLVNRFPATTAALCGEARQKWRAVDDWACPEKFTRCPTCQAQTSRTTPGAHP